MTPLAIAVAGEALELWPQRALHWPARSTLLIADLHLGKGDAFRRAGLALPRGGTASDLARLGDLLARTGATRLLVLGDVLHGAVHAAPWVADWEAWRDTHTRVRFEAVVGNHDRALRQAGLGLALHEAALHEAPFVFRHVPAADAAGYVWAGHVHPVRRLPGLGRALPAFHVGHDVGVLPAFSAFTGGCEVAARTGDRVLVCAGDFVVAAGGAA